MKGKILHIVFCGLFLLLPFLSEATHIVGGSLTYVYNGGNSYTFTLKLYRDCSAGTAAMPGTGDLTVNVDGFNGASSTPSLDFTLTRISITRVPTSLDSCAIKPNPEPCVEEGIFTATTNLPPSVGGYHCYINYRARNFSLTNINATNNMVGETFYCYIPSPTDIWTEGFTLPNGTTTDAGTTDWTKTNGLTPPNSAQVNSNTFTVTGANNGSVTWTSGIIDISGATSGVSVYSLISESGNLDANDSIKFFYKLDGGPLTPFTSNGSIRDDFNSAIVSTTGLTGSTLQIVIYVKYDGSSPSSENYIIDYVNVFSNIIVNSDPAFNSFPPLYLCLNQAFTFDHSASDPDGDSLVYSFYTPYDGYAGTSTPVAPTYANNVPTFTPVIFLPGYSTNSPLGGSPLTLDPNSGLLSGTPTEQGQFVVGIKVTEYRNGIKLSETIRDFQFNVIVCPNPAEAIISSFKSCDDKTVLFTQQGDTTVTPCWWNFGVNSLTNDTSIKHSPSYTYPDTGNYTVTLIINKGTSCADTATAPVYIGWADASFTTTNAQCVGLPVNFTNTSTTSNNAAITSYSWNFGDGSTSTLANPSHTYASTGTYTISLTINTNIGCTDTYSTTTTVGPKPTVNAGTDQTICSSTNSVNINGTIANATGGTWSTLGTGSFTSATSSLGNTYTPSAADAAAGTVTLILTSVSASVCTITDTVKINITTTPTTANAGADQTICGTSTANLNGNTPAVGTGVWSVVSGAATISNANSPTTMVTGLVAGNTYVFKWTITNGATCVSSDQVSVFVDLLPTTALAGSDIRICNNTATPLSGNTPTVGTPSWAILDGTGALANSNTTSPTLSGLTVGDTTTIRYTITKGVCKSTDDLMVIVDKPRTANAGADQTLCNQGPVVHLNGVLGNSVTGIWSGGSGTFSPGTTVLTPTYNPTASEISTGIINLILTTTDNASCPAAKDSVKVFFVPFEGTVSTNTVSPTCNGFANGSATATVAGAATPYTYTWNSTPIQYAAGAINLAQGSYNVTIKDNRGCTTTSSVTINQPAVLAGSPSSTLVSCNGGSDGSATVTANGGTSPYTYSWSNGYTGGPVNSNLSAGTYSVTVTDGKNCTVVKNIVVSQPTLLAPVLSKNNVSCNQGADGSITINSSGGTAPYTYTWNPSVSSVSSATGLAAGVYSILVTDAKGCTKTLSTTITQPNSLNATSTQVNISCFGGTDGSATVSAAGGTPGYTYTWDTPLVSNSPTVTGLSSGIYVATISDANACSTQVIFTITQPTLLSSSISSAANVSCFGQSNGQIMVSTTGGTSPYAYSWNPSVSTLNTATGLTTGTYNIVITDAKGCANNLTQTITQPPLLQASEIHTNPTCFNYGNGTITTNVSGGISPYSYSWNTPGMGNTGISNALGAGSYSIVVSDSNLCTQTLNITLTQPDSIALTGISNNSTCGNANGSASISASGGSGGYTYSWSNGTISNSISNVNAGPYSVTVTDVNGCRNTKYLLVNDVAGPTIQISNTTNVSCFGGTDGTATVGVLNGTPPYTYTWTTTPTQHTTTATGLSAGEYAVQVTDSNGCVTNAVTTPPISEPDSLSSLQSFTHLNCFQDASGTISIIASGGTAPYSISWQGLSDTTFNLASLQAGLYTYTIKDSKNCLYNKTLTLIQPLLLDLSVTSLTDALCYGDSNGTASLEIVGGTGPYTYSWTNGTSTGLSATDLNAGTHSIYVNDAHNCKDSITISINEPAAALDGIITTQDVLCYGGTNGNASVVASGGNGTYSYTWFPSLNNGTTEQNLPSGTFHILLSDNKGCLVVKSVDILQPEKIEINSTLISSTCGYANGTAITQASGGTPGYTYTWSGSSSQDSSANGLAAGIYYLTVKDANLCTAYDTVVITNIPSPQITSFTATPVSCFGGSNGSATAHSITFAEPVQFTWDPGVSNDSIAADLSAGTYSVFITDANGCKDTAIVIIGQSTEISLDSLYTEMPLCYGDSNGYAEAFVNGGNAPYTYTWSNFTDTTSYVNNLFSGTFSLQIKDAFGCTKSHSFTLAQPAKISTDAQTQFNATCYEYNDGIAFVNVNGGTFPYQYTWNSQPEQYTGIAANLSAGTYIIHVKDTYGCSTSDTVTITEPNPVVAAINGGNSICKGNSVTLTANVNGGNGGPYSYVWDPVGTTSQTLTDTPVNNTLYVLTATDFRGCVSVIDTQLVNVYNLDTADIVIHLRTPICPGNFTLLSAESLGSNTGPLTYSWNNGLPTGPGVFQIYPNAPTTYTVTVATSCGIAVKKSASLTFNPPPKIKLTSDGNRGCVPLAISFTDSSNALNNDPITEWLWNFGDGTTSTEQHPLHTYQTPGNYYVSLSVSTLNGCTSKTSTTYLAITAISHPEADFQYTPNSAYIPHATYYFIDQSTNDPYTYYWNFGDLQTSTLKNPKHVYENIGTYPVTLIAENSNGCKDTITKYVIVSSNMAVPNAFTPGGSGPGNGIYDPNALDNDIFHPFTADVKDFNFRVYNRWGELIFETNDIKVGWDGYYRGQLCQEGVYVWQIKATFLDGSTFDKTGDVTLIR